jgi:thiol-disulfide isomerase/thioredoxin
MACRIGHFSASVAAVKDLATSLCDRPKLETASSKPFELVTGCEAGMTRLFGNVRRIGIVAGLALSTLASLAPSPAQALELVMFDAPWCGYCRQFRREVVPIYQRTVIGRKIPLQIVDLDGQEGVTFNLDEGVAGVPTFVLVHDNNEVARFSGYSGSKDFFETLADEAQPFLGK